MKFGHLGMRFRVEDFWTCAATEVCSHMEKQKSNWENLG